MFYLPLLLSRCRWRPRGPRRCFAAALLSLEARNHSWMFYLPLLLSSYR